MENFDLIEELVVAIKELSPLVWEAAEKQVQAQIIISALWLVGYVIAGKILFIVFKWSIEESEKDLLEQNTASIPGLIFGGIGLILVTIFFLGSLNVLISAIVAPEYQTIKLLIDLVE